MVKNLGVHVHRAMQT